jgi:hypothetical protein
VPLLKAKALKPMEIINMDIVSRTAMEDEKSDLLVGRQKKNRKRSKKIPMAGIEPGIFAFENRFLTHYAVALYDIHPPSPSLKST